MQKKEHVLRGHLWNFFCVLSRVALEIISCVHIIVLKITKVMLTTSAEKQIHALSVSQKYSACYTAKKIYTFLNIFLAHEKVKLNKFVLNVANEPQPRSQALELRLNQPHLPRNSNGPHLRHLRCQELWNGLWWRTIVFMSLLKRKQVISLTLNTKRRQTKTYKMAFIYLFYFIYLCIYVFIYYYIDTDALLGNTTL